MKKLLIVFVILYVISRKKNPPASGSLLAIGPPDLSNLSARLDAQAADLSSMNTRLQSVINQLNTSAFDI